MPCRRKMAMFKMVGIKLPASTINGWFQGSCDLLRALYALLKEIVLK
ncbi:IS66 family transposase, partial [Saccharicrinis fermentans]